MKKIQLVISIFVVLSLGFAIWSPEINFPKETHPYGVRQSYGAWPIVSSQGQIAFIDGSSNTGEWSLCIAENVDALDKHDVECMDGDPGDYTWSANGRYLAYTTETFIRTYKIVPPGYANTGLRTVTQPWSERVCVYDTLTKKTDCAIKMPLYYHQTNSYPMDDGSVLFNCAAQATPDQVSVCEWTPGTSVRLTRDALPDTVELDSRECHYSYTDKNAVYSNPAVFYYTPQPLPDGRILVAKVIDDQPGPLMTYEVLDAYPPALCEQQ